MFKRKRLIIIFVVLVLVMAAAIVVSNYANQASVGTVTQNGSKSTSNQAVFNFKPKVVTDKYVSFAYPKSLTKSPNNPQYPPQVDQFNFSYKDSQTWDLSISIDNVSYNVTENSGYTLRKNNPSEYTETESTINGQLVYVFQDKAAAGFGKVAFFGHGTYQASVALTGDDFGNEANLQKTFTQVLSSWHWKVS